MLKLTQSSVPSIISILTLPRLLRNLFLYLTRLHLPGDRHLTPLHTSVSEKKESISSGFTVASGWNDEGLFSKSKMNRTFLAPDWSPRISI